MEKTGASFILFILFVLLMCLRPSLHKPGWPHICGDLLPLWHFSLKCCYYRHMSPNLTCFLFCLKNYCFTCNKNLVARREVKRKKLPFDSTCLKNFKWVKGGISLQKYVRKSFSKMRRWLSSLLISVCICLSVWCGHMFMWMYAYMGMHREIWDFISKSP